MPYYAAPQPMQADPRAPAKRASILMFVVGAMALLFGGCMGFTAAMLPRLRDMPEVRQTLATLESQAGVSATTLIIIAAVLFGVIGLAQIILGIFVRRGGLVIAIVGIIFTSLVLIYMCINLAISIITPGQLGGACMSVVVAAVFVAQLILLIQACRNAGQVRWMQQMYAGQTAWPQQQAPYAQQPVDPPGVNYGYGYGAPQQQPARPATPQQPPQPPDERASP